MKILDIKPFENAIKSLSEVIQIWKSDMSNNIVRDSMIQRFEYTYSLSLKMVKRFLKQTDLVDNEVNEMTFNELIRKANQFNLLRTNLETWNEYRQKRNMTSHTYDEVAAMEVASIIPDFKDEAEFLLNKLKEHFV